MRFLGRTYVFTSSKLFWLDPKQLVSKCISSYSLFIYVFVNDISSSCDPNTRLWMEENCSSSNKKRSLPYELTKILLRELTHASVKFNVT